MRENHFMSDSEKNNHPEIVTMLDRQAQNESGEDLLEKRVAMEQAVAKEMFKELLDTVDARYENLTEKTRADLMFHKNEVLDKAIELGIRNGFSEKELKTFEMAAILHDISKADKAPAEYEHIDNYVLAMHGELAAAEVPALLTDAYLARIGFSENDFEDIRIQVADAIRQHMGPHPGFMDFVLNGVNAKLREMGKSEIAHPEAVGKISEALLATDMYSLADSNGRKKILSIRSENPGFIKTDEELCAEYAKHGVDLNRAEAALISGFDSAFQARDMIKDEKNREWMEQAIEESKYVAYDDGQGGKINWGDVEMKKRLLEAAKKIRLAA